MIVPLLSARIIQVSTRVPLDSEAAQELAALGVELPSSLENAIAKRRDEYLAGRYCAAMALKRGGVGEVSRISVKIDGSAEWPPGWAGAITHAHGLASAAVGRSSEVAGVGIDSEPVMSEASAKKLRERFLFGAELEPGARPKGFTEPEWVTLIFSAKETIYKCLRPLSGEFFGFEDAEIYEVSESRGIFRFRLTQPIGRGFIKGWQAEGRFAREPGWIHSAMELAADQNPNR